MIRRSPRFSFETSEKGGLLVLALCDSHYHADSLDALEAKFREVEGQAPKGIVIVDLARVALLSSTALRAMRASFRRLEPVGGRIVAAAGGELVRGVLKFAPFIEHYRNLDEAVAAMNAPAAEDKT